MPVCFGFDGIRVWTLTPHSLRLVYRWSCLKTGFHCSGSDPRHAQQPALRLLTGGIDTPAAAQAPGPACLRAFGRSGVRRAHDSPDHALFPPHPIGYGDGLNLYAYVGGDPVNATDPSGLMADPAPDACHGGPGICVTGQPFCPSFATRLRDPAAIQDLLQSLHDAFSALINESLREVGRQIEEQHALNCLVLNELPIPPGSEIEALFAYRFGGKVTVGRAQDGSIYYGGGIGAGYGASVGISEIFTGRQTSRDFAGLSVSFDYDNPVSFAKAVNSGKNFFASGIALGLDINLLAGKSFTAKDFGGELGAQYGRGFGVTLNATASSSAQ